MSRKKTHERDRLEEEAMHGIPLESVSSQEATSGHPYVEPLGQPNQLPSWCYRMRAVLIFSGVVLLLFSFIVASILLHNSKFHWPGRVDRTGAIDVAITSNALGIWRLVPAFGKVSNLSLTTSCKGQVCPDMPVKQIQMGANTICLQFPPLYECSGCNDDKLWVGTLAADAHPTWERCVPVTVWFSDILTTHDGQLCIGTDGQASVTPNAWDLLPAAGEHLRFRGPTDPVCFVAQI